ncbi:hypothetical protein E1301_Tti013459 [Triplophysa tibetana]|uniref:Ig-like domain-containing protein n=1 Tax=Triplophysa tibetana TaxID=1572043 RepID=A0A5A9NQ56_9TELE|nr:hypothetical protein E1301_Tti013459 [Triplophysa tibetana]
MRSFCKSIVLLFVCGVFVDVTDVKSVSVNEGESVTLHTNVTKLLNTDNILWRFGENDSAKLIAEMSGGSITYEDLDDGRFRDRLQIFDLQTGSLIIKNIRHKHSGRYEVDHEGNTGTTYKKFRVTVNDAPSVIGAEQSDVKLARVIEGDSVTLNTDVQTQRDDLILWRFGDEGVLLAKGDKEVNKDSIYDDVLDGRFRDRLKLDDQTGSLTITNTKTTDTGVYKLKIINNRDTKYRTFSVSVSERGLSEGQVTGIICGVLLVIAVVGVIGVIVYRRIKYKQQKQKVKVMTLPGRHSVTLETDVTKPQSVVIQWSFRDKEIATLKKNKISINNERLRDRLQVDDQTGSLMIKDIRSENTGLYKVKISSSSRVKSFLQFITGGGPSYRQFNVLIREERIELALLGLPVILYTDVTGIQTDDVIQWRFGNEEILIAERTVGTEPSYDERFKERLKLNPKTGDLTITNITSELSGVYKVKINSSRGSEDKDYRVVISVFADRGESVTIHTESEIQRDSEIKWISEDKTILVTGKNGDDNETKYTDDVIFRDRLEMNHHTGDLTITHIRQTDAGVYILQEINSDGKILYRIFSVYVRDWIKTVEMGGSVTLKTDVTEIHRGHEIKWRFGDEEPLIAEMTGDIEPSYVSTDERFRDRLKMTPQTGHLTISNITSELSGVYKAQISSSRGTEYRKYYRTYRVVISAPRTPTLMKLKSAGTEGNETTTVVMPLLNEAEDRF